MIKVLVVDDSAFMRKKLTEILESDPEIEVIATARDGEDAIRKAEEYLPDVITLDINMPRMDGLTALRILMQKKIAPVVMVSSLTQEGAEITLKALEMGAFDFVPKPGGTISLDIDKVKEDIIEKVRAAATSSKKFVVRKELAKKTMFDVSARPTISTQHEEQKPFKAIVIGISTGGPKTIMDVLPYLPPNLNACVFLIQHMPPTFTAQYAKRLNENCQIEVIEASAGMKVEKSKCYVGKGGYHLTLYGTNIEDLRIRLTQKPEHRFMPSVDVCMMSVLEKFQENTIGVLMTGMGDDGADAMVKIRQRGGITIAESEETAIVFGMPREAILRGGADYVLPSYKIAEKLIELIGQED
ncbi:response regulator receiver modulated CheB methylesterase [Caldicellulosiruptor kronotskyensis 2002]|uniref:Protein-glutamate methylesterase/protein-glutamine glutaminase n=1 Tax=Caldicellulosiruptor kronotskyensis (strain DSM 18902 / VKM B-2412 / 2002) TaxID=632348 RepID=E4SE24_CALK2|nr:chemotaxis response regulator protein-glutamate methylesterase [Caldicellulosiruptor kronotskyensis]ADQ45311.1 response regulator receiver modulated CheB methylesterase [Caldicellulosiruptor kronotskyensis 2002]